MSETRFTDQHEWVRVDGETATVGITKFAAGQLGDIVYVDLPESGRKVGQGGEIAVVESVKAASEVYAPIGGEVSESNAVLSQDPAKINMDPEGEGWFFRMRVTDASEFSKLMTESQYSEFLKTL
ncbi:MAG: glycine cleavage system protein GcvH [Rhizomicrobium sp.]